MPNPEQGATAAAGAKTGTTSALDLVEQLSDVVQGLKRELRSYDDQDSVGRNTRGLTDYFARIHHFEVTIAQAMNIDWVPGSS